MQPKVKITKHGSKLPDVFKQPRPIIPRDRQRRNTEKQRANSQKEKSNLQQKQINNQQQMQVRKQGAFKKKSRNPFMPMREWLKLSKEMAERMEEVRQGLELDKLSKLSFESNPDILNKIQTKDSKIKYEDCLTLNLLKKTQTNCLKKILHVPTLTVYFLRESLIDFSIDKNDLEDWIKKCNSTANQSQNYIRPQKIIQLYWNIPESYYSIVYQYTDTVLFDAILQNTSIFPIQFIQNMALSHLKADLQIYNSVLLIKRNPQSSICYLPVYEEIDDIIPQYRAFRQLLKINSPEQNEAIKAIERKMVARLGFLILVTFFSDAIVDEDIANILFESKDCCLFHKQMNNPSSLLKIFFDNNVASSLEKEILSDLFCKILKFKPEERVTFSELSKHRFFKTKFSRQICRMSEVISMLQSAGSSAVSSKNPSKELSLHKMNKILEGIQLILKGTTQIEKSQIDLSFSNENIKYLLHELGLGNTQAEIKVYFGQIVEKLKKTYGL